MKRDQKKYELELHIVLGILVTFLNQKQKKMN